jgi:3-methyladenine DNA glycosylase AlkD
VSAGFFKTGKGEYGEGDVFLGVTVPNIRRVARDSREIPRSEISQLLRSRLHEERLLALIILVDKFNRANDHEQEAIYNFYLLNLKYINNWDLVDVSAPIIIGEYQYSLVRANKKTVPALFVKMARAKSIWERRIAMLSTFAFIKRGQSEQALRVADLLRHDEHDLIQKAVGWMLREVGKKCSVQMLEQYLKPRYKRMPRTMLRYAIERFSLRNRERYLKGRV